MNYITVHKKRIFYCFNSSKAYINCHKNIFYLNIPIMSRFGQGKFWAPFSRNFTWTCSLSVILYIILNSLWVLCHKINHHNICALEPICVFFNGVGIFSNAVFYFLKLCFEFQYISVLWKTLGIILTTVAVTVFIDFSFLNYIYLYFVIFLLQDSFLLTFLHFFPS